MSIILLAQGQAPPQVPPELVGPVMALLGALTVASPLIAWAVGVFRPPGVHGPARFWEDDSLVWFFVVLAGAVLSLFAGVRVFFWLLAGMGWEQTFRVYGAGLLGSVFPALIVLLASAFTRRHGLRLIGLKPEDIPRGLGAGLAGVLIVLPWLLWLTIAGEAVLKKLGVQAPTEHEIFRLWREHGVPRGFKELAFVSAVLIAPFAEELMFRGVLQTALGRLFTRRRPPPPQTEPLPAGATEPSESGPPILTYATPPRHWLPDPPAGARWIAIIVTAAIFASIHSPAFIIPPIFLLAIGLGYVYERTGTLWAPIFMHMLFNGLEFALFLTLQGGGH